jgi:hypothetical protein
MVKKEIFSANRDARVRGLSGFGAGNLNQTGNSLMIFRRGRFFRPETH